MGPVEIDRFETMGTDGQRYTIRVLRTYRQEFNMIEGRHWVANARPVLALDDGREVYQLADSEDMFGADGSAVQFRRISN